MPLHNWQLRPYLKERELKFYEIDLLDMIDNEKPGFDGRLLDIASASGNFLCALRDRFPSSHLFGLELNDELIAIAETRLKNKHTEIIKADAQTYRPPATFDVATASGILQCFQDPLSILKTWIEWISPSGLLVIYGKFNSKEVDTRILFKSHDNPHGWEEGFTSYSIRTISEFLSGLDIDFEFKRFHLPIDLPESEDPVRNYTVKLKTGETLLINGANLICEPYFLIIRKH